MVIRMSVSVIGMDTAWPVRRLMSSRHTGFYEPPLCDFNRVILNLTVTSRGRQFDRLASLFLGDIEIFRTSTAEPTARGIRWTYSKDVSSYLVLFEERQKVIFDLGNLIDEKYTAPFNVTLTASFFNDSIPTEAATLILPISARRSSEDQPSAFSLPSDRAYSNISVPRRTYRAVVSLLATGQADEEFWYGNVPDSQKEGFPSNPGPWPGHSPFREVQLWINGSLAGVVAPYPVIFTGGFCPQLWRPVVGIDAFDLRAGEIDITPWLPLLWNGEPAGVGFEIKVVGIDDDGKGNGTLSKSVGDYWVVTGSVHLWADNPARLNSGSIQDYSAPDPRITIEMTTGDRFIIYSISIQRQISITASRLDGGDEIFSTWSQTIETLISGKLYSAGLLGPDQVQSFTQQTSGFDASSSGFTNKYHQEITVELDSLPIEKDGVYLEGLLQRSLAISGHGPSVALLARPHQQHERLVRQNGGPLSTAELKTKQGGSFTMEIHRGAITFAAAATDQQLNYFKLEGAPALPDIPDKPDVDATRGESYTRNVLAHNGVLLRDEESLNDEVVADAGQTRPRNDRGSSLPDVDVSTLRRLVHDKGARQTKAEPEEILGRLPRTLNIHLRSASTKPSWSGWVDRCVTWIVRWVRPV